MSAGYDRHPGYIAQCPVCFNDWDCQTQRETDRLVRTWEKRIAEIVVRALKRRLG